MTPVIRVNAKKIDAVPTHKNRYKSVVGASIISRANIAITIVCQADGKPPPNITWTMNGDPIVPNDVVKVLDRGRIRIKSLSDDYVGIYKCRAENVHGFDTASSKITVYSKIWILS